MSTHHHKHGPRIRETYTFAVEGSGYFPLDMLRYDVCWPCDDVDSNLLRDWHEAPVKIVLRSNSYAWPTRERWQSRGWHVLGIGMLRRADGTID